MKIGVDLGGTQMRAALVDDYGNINHQEILPTMAAQGADAVTERMIGLVKSLPNWAAADFIGVGVPCGVGRDGSSLKLASNLPGMDGYPLRERLMQALGRDVLLENDAKLACLGEALYGAGVGFDHMAYLTISTGIGGGYFYDGRLLRGARGLAAEFGSMSIDPARRARNDLPKGAAESELSGTGLTRRANELTGRSYRHAGEVFKNAAGDRYLQGLVDDFTHGIAVLLSNIACVLDPEVFVLGGGCMMSSAFFISGLMQQYRDFAQKEYQDVSIAIAQLDQPGLVGAAMLQRAR